MVQARFSQRDLLQRLACVSAGLPLDRLAAQLSAADAKIALADFLSELQRGGLVEFRARRWRLTARGASTLGPKPTAMRPSVAPTTNPTPPTPIGSPKGPKSGRRSQAAAQINYLAAIRLHSARTMLSTKRDDAIQTEAGGTALRSLLTYYRACLEAEEHVDLKGDFAEGGARFVPAWPNGPWMPAADVRLVFTVARRDLPAEFQQALGRSKPEGAVYLGYPIDVFEPNPGSLLVRAIASLPLRWKAPSPELVTFEAIDTQFSLNGRWINHHRKTVDLVSLSRRRGTALARGHGGGLRQAASVTSSRASEETGRSSAGRKPSRKSAALLACDAARTMARLSSRRTSAHEPI
jgi:hypothetical protein